MEQEVAQVEPCVGALGNHLDRVLRVGDPHVPRRPLRIPRAEPEREKELVLGIQTVPVLPRETADALHIGRREMPAVGLDQHGQREREGRVQLHRAGEERRGILEDGPAVGGDAVEIGAQGVEVGGGERAELGRADAGAERQELGREPVDQDEQAVLGAATLVCASVFPPGTATSDAFITR